MVHERQDSKALAGYALLREAVQPAELKAWLKARLPEYMVPSSITVLETMPLTPSGKVDRRALPAPQGASAGTRRTPPRDAVELRLLQLWNTVLGVAEADIHDAFFDLGGHSLLAMRLMSLIEQHFGVRLPVALLFQHPTVAALTEMLRRGPGADAAAAGSHVVPIHTGGDAALDWHLSIFGDQRRSEQRRGPWPLGTG